MRVSVNISESAVDAVSVVMTLDPEADYLVVEAGGLKPDDTGAQGLAVLLEDAARAIRLQLELKALGISRPDAEAAAEGVERLAGLARDIQSTKPASEILEDFEDEGFDDGKVHDPSLAPKLQPTEDDQLRALMRQREEPREEHVRQSSYPTPEHVRAQRAARAAERADTKRAKRFNPQPKGDE